MTPHNQVTQLNEYFKAFMEGKLDRRSLLLRAGALGLPALTMAAFARAVPASAQDASPQAAVLPGGYQSITYADYRASLAEDFPFTVGGEKTGGTLIMGELATANLTTTNIHFADNSPTQPMLLQVFETLWGNDPRDGQYVPLLADSWEIAEDGRTYTFHLNSDVTFHDGTPMTAADVELSHAAQQDESTGSSYTSTFLQAVESFRAVDDNTFEIVANEVLAQVVFFGNIFAGVVPVHIWGDVPFDQWQLDPGSTGTDPSRVVGTGYLKFVEINEGDGTATFEKNADHWWADDVPSIDTFIFSTWPDDTAAIEALRSGEFDFYENVPPADVESLQTGDGTDVALYDTYSFSFYGTNLDPEKSTLFQDLEVRQAMMYALDRQSMVDNIMLGYAEVANGTQPTLSPAYAPDRIDTTYDYDPDRAAELLESAGWILNEDGVREKDGVPLSFEIMTNTGSAVAEQLIVAMQDFWKAVGIDGQPTLVDFDTVLIPALTETFDYEVISLGFNWDPTGDQSAMFNTDSYGGGFNFVKYSNPDYDALSDAAGVELDPEARNELLIEATNVVNEDLPVGVLWFRQDRTGYRSNLQDFVPNGVSLLWTVPYVQLGE